MLNTITPFNNSLFEMSSQEGERGARDLQVLEESSNGFQPVGLFTKHRTNRKLFLYGEVDNAMANEFVAQMLYFAETGEPVDIYINSCGGSVDAGLVLYDVISACDGKIPLNMYCTGLAASMAAVIFAAGQKGRRYILPNSRCMLHEPLINGGVGGSATSIKKTSDSILETKTKLAEILAKHTGRTVEEINEATSFDNFMTAEEAIKFGLCDEIKNII